MLNRFAAIAVGAGLVLAPGLFAQDNQWTISGYDSFANFSVRHLMISKASGKIGGIKGTVIYDPKDPSKDAVDVTLDVNTFFTGEPKRDVQVKTDYFEVQKYPTMSFKSTKVAAAADGGLTITGNLTIKGTTKQVVLAAEKPIGPVKDAQGRTKVGVSATTKISRKDFGIVGTALDGVVEAGGIIVSDQVSIDLDIELTPPAAAAPAAAATH